MQALWIEELANVHALILLILRPWKGSMILSRSFKGLGAGKKV